MVKNIVANNVEFILATQPHTRNSDSELVLEFMDHLGIHLSPADRDRFRSLSIESITRCRRKLQEEGKYLPSPAVALRRRLKSYIVQQNIPKAKPENVPTLINQEVFITEDK